MELGDGVVQDVRQALRRLRRAPGLSLSIVTTLGLALAASVATFSVLNAILLKKLPYRDPDRVYEWATELATDTPVVVYCAYGFNVSCAVTGVLREQGFDARFLRGGLSAWFGAGGARALRATPVAA